MTSDENFLDQAIRLAEDNIAGGGHPFGAVVVRDGRVIASGVNEMHLAPDPTAHAETVAIRHAATALGSADLRGCTVYASGHPCPMCMAAMRFAGVSRVVYAYSNDDGAAYGLSTAAIRAELCQPEAAQSMEIRHLGYRRKDADNLYAIWQAARARR